MPAFGPARFRAWVGLLFLPYTGMVLAFTVIGAMLAPDVDWSRVGALLVVYFLALGIAAHALDALGRGGSRPWGNYFTRPQLLALAGIALVMAYVIGIFYIVTAAPLLLPVAILEGFFLFAYNLEWFGGRYHTDFWFAFSWGALPVLAGYVLQTNAFTPEAIIVAAGAAALGAVEIKASRPYKLLRRTARDDVARAHLRQYENILKAVSAAVLLLALGLSWSRWTA